MRDSALKREQTDSGWQQWRHVGEELMRDSALKLGLQGRARGRARVSEKSSCATAL